MSRRHALVVGDVASRASLAAVRALAAVGWQVDVGVPRRSGPAVHSRHTAAVHLVPRPEVGAEPYAAAVRRAVELGQHSVVLGSSDADALTLSLMRDQLGDVRLALPSHEACLAAFDKSRLHAAAREVHLRVPATWSADELPQVRFPALVKSSTHWLGGAPGARSRHDALLVADEASASSRLQELAALGVAAFLQEVVVGHNMSFSTVAGVGGRLLARAQHETRITWPRAAGVTAQAVSLPVDDALAGRVQALLARLGWTGIAELEFRVGADGVPQLIDFNGRVFDSIALAFAAGVNLPDAAARVALGLPSEETVQDAAGGRWFQWFEGDLAAAVTGPRPTADGLRALARAPWSTHPVLSRSDPKPALAHAGAVARAQLGKRLRSRPA